MTAEYKPYPPSFYHIDKLKSLTRFRDSPVRQHSRQLVELTNILDKTFPEFKPFFKGRLSVTALYILSNYQAPEKIANMHAYKPLRKLSRGRFTMSDFIQLKALAKNTVGASNDYLIDQMEILLELYNLIDAKVDVLDNQIKESIRCIDPLASLCPASANCLLPSSFRSLETSASSRIPQKCFPLPAWSLVTSNPASLNLPAIWLNTVPPSSGMPS